MAEGSPLLKVKRSIPPVRSGAIPRARLEQRLDVAARLTLVVAPAGWGKTSLLSRWASGLTGMRVAWVSLDEGDDEPVRFWSYVLTALQEASGEVSSAPAAALAASSEGPMSHALPLLLNELAAAAEQHVLVLDDYHLITRSEVHENLEFLVAYAPPALRVVVGSRVDPPLPLARMRVRGQLGEIRADDLRFSAEESAAMLAVVAESAPDESTADAVWRRTEGWAAGLQLAGLALRGGAVVARDGDRHLFDYFEEEVLPTLTPDQRDLLIRAAPLELLSGSLCDAALEVTGSAAVLAELEYADLFVAAVDPEREWYRCHRLLRDALGWSPGSKHDDATRDVLRRAAQWFSRHGRFDDAVRHLQRAGDDEAAADLLAGREQWFLQAGRASMYLALGEDLPEAVVRPQLALYLAYAASVTGNHDRIVHWLDVCGRHIDATSVVEGWRSPRAAELSLRAVLASDPSEPEHAVAWCEQALALETAAGAPQNPVVMMALGLAYGSAGRFEAATRLLGECWRMRGHGPWSTGVDLQVAGQLGLFLLAQGADDELDRLLIEAVPAADTAEREWGEAAAGPVVVMIRLVDGRRRYQRGDIVTAGARLSQGLRLAEIAGRPLYSLLGLLFTADLELATGDRPKARRTLVRAREIVDNEAVTPFVTRWLEEAETRIGRAASRAANERGALYEELTDRELSILRMLPGTASQREIGAALFLSINTVKAYNKSLYRKLDVGSRHEAVATARRLGLI